MRRLLNVRLLAVLFAAILTATSALAAGPQFPAGSRAGIEPPEGFALSQSFSGFESVDTGASIIVMTMPGEAFTQLAEGFTKEAVASKGITMTSNGSIENFDPEHFFIRGTQESAMGLVEKYILIAEGPVTVLLTANVPQAAIEEGLISDEEILASFQSLVIAEGTPGGDARAALPYDIVETKRFAFERTVGGMGAVFTDNTSLQEEGAPVPLFIAVHSINKSRIRNFSATAQTRFLQITDLTGIKTEEHDEISIDGLDGFETTGTALDLRSRHKMAVYQVMLKPPPEESPEGPESVQEGSNYYRMVGIAPAEHTPFYMAEFRAMANSFHRRQSPIIIGQEALPPTAAPAPALAPKTEETETETETAPAPKTAPKTATPDETSSAETSSAETSSAETSSAETSSAETSSAEPNKEEASEEQASEEQASNFLMSPAQGQLPSDQSLFSGGSQDDDFLLGE